MKARQDETVAVLIDMQEKLLPVMQKPQRLTENVLKLLKGLRVLGVPVLVTEQYPKGLGRTLEPLRDVLGANQRYIEKTSFSVMGERSFERLFGEIGKGTVILCGIESHVCVLQSVLDLQDAGYDCVVVADAVSSRKASDEEVAIERMRSAGAVVSTVESVLFELLVDAKNPEFGEISKLIK